MHITGAGYGVFAKTFILPNTWLAEYDGEILRAEDEDIITDYAWQTYHDQILTHYIDGGRIETSNWPRWINCPNNSRQENVKGVSCMGKVIYITFKPICPGQELFVYYGDGYASLLGIDVKQFPDH